MPSLELNKFDEEKSNELKEMEEKLQTHTSESEERMVGLIKEVIWLKEDLKAKDTECRSLKERLNKFKEKQLNSEQENKNVVLTNQNKRFKLAVNNDQKHLETRESNVNRATQTKDIDYNILLEEEKSKTKTVFHHNLKQLKSEMGELEIKLSESAYNTLQEEKAKLESRNEVLQSKCHELNLEIDKLKCLEIEVLRASKANQRLEVEIASLREQQKEVESKNENLQNKSVELNQEINKLKCLEIDFVNASKANKILEEKIVNLREQEEKLESTNLNWQNKCHELEVDIEKLKVLEIKFLNASETSQRLEEENTSLKNSRAELETKYQELRNKSEELMLNIVELNSLTMKVSDAERTIEILKEEKKKLLSEKYQNESKQQTENESMKNKIKELKSEVGDLSVQNDFIESRIHEIKEEEDCDNYESALLDMSSDFLAIETKLRKKLKIAEYKLQLLLYVINNSLQREIITDENGFKNVQDLCKFITEIIRPGSYLDLSGSGPMKQEANY